MAEYNEQCKKCFHFQVCAQVMKNQLFIREKMLKEESPKCEHFVNAADVVEVRHGKWIYEPETINTIEEALGLLNDMEFNKKYQGKQEYAEMLLVCKEALEKQIAKEHHHTKVFRCNSKARESICPSCLGVIITAANEYPKHCTWCGQKIDWSDTNA